MPSCCAVARSCSPAPMDKTPTRSPATSGATPRPRATPSTSSTSRGFQRRFSKVRSVRIPFTELSIPSEPRTCENSCTALQGSLADRVACGLWIWPPRSASRKALQKSGLRARPSGPPWRGWEPAGSAPNAGLPAPTRSTKEKKASFASDRLMRLAENNEGWAVGFCEECWWSRLALPSLNSWAQAGKPMRLIQQSLEKDDPDPKAISCYGLYVPELEKMWLRFVDGRPVSSVTTQFLRWCCQKLEVAGKRVWVLIWDNASWHTSKEVREWIASHNRRVKASGKGVRIISCLLPKKSPWLNPIEPKWVHGKRRVVEADGLLTAWELADRACAAFDCLHYEHLSVTENVA